ncbi:MAG: RluA family pseudouridine synthase [Cyanobacteria bacterium SIG32]|nr:RluA family pseudouridine synthase [Cyanobacteria bacterium SIG32]
MIIFIDENDENKRLDNYLSDMFTDISRSKIQKYIKDGKVLVNNAEKKPAYFLKEGDKVEFEKLEEEELKIEPQNIPLDIVYEDDNMLVVNKPSGMLTHPTTIERENTLVNALLYKYGDNLSDLNGEFRRGILHRLDRNTSGLLMIAKNNMAHEFLAQQIKDHTITKKYRAIVKGNYNGDEDRIEEPIGRHPKYPHKMAIVPVKDGGKESVTLLKVLERFKEATYVELTLITGRTHQIRVHMSHRHHPVYNDSMYGSGEGRVKTEEQVLQSYYLSFTKPITGEIIELEIEPDEKLNKVLTFYRNRRN